jgi:hypothetical protein
VHVTFALVASAPRLAVKRLWTCAWHFRLGPQSTVRHTLPGRYTYTILDICFETNSSGDYCTSDAKFVWTILIYVLYFGMVLCVDLCEVKWLKRDVRNNVLQRVRRRRRYAGS